MYKTLSKTSKLIGVHRNTILNWKKRGLIRYTVTPTGQFLYDITKYVKHITQTHHCKIIIVKEDNLSPEEEIVIDLTSIIHSFSTKLYGRRKYTVKQNV